MFFDTAAACYVRFMNLGDTALYLVSVSQRDTEP